MFPHWVTPLPHPNHDSFVSHHWRPVSHMVSGVRSFLYLKPNDSHCLLFLPLSYPLLGTVLELIWSLVGLNDSEEVSWVASILQIFQRRGKVRHWLVFSVWMGRSWDLNPGVIKLWIALPLTSPHCLMFLSRIDHTWLWRCWRIKSHYSRRVLWVRGLPLHL